MDQTGAGNAAHITQSGTQNRSAVSNAGVVSPGIAQVGDFNVGTVDQTGDGNEAKTYVNGDGNTTAIVQVGTVNNALSSGNIGIDIRRGSGNHVAIHQDGTDNAARFTVGAASASADGNVLSTSQDGSGNRSRGIIQGLANTVTLDQVGQRNDAGFVVQGSGASVGNVISVAQGVRDGGGELNVASGRVWRGSGNVLSVVQEGTANHLGADFISYDGVQVYGDHNDVAVTQDGAGNHATVLVGVQPVGSTSTFSTDNTVTVDQLGVGHMADASAVGHGNTSTITQN